MNECLLFFPNRISAGCCAPLTAVQITLLFRIEQFFFEKGANESCEIFLTTHLYKTYSISIVDLRHNIFFTIKTKKSNSKN